MFHFFPRFAHDVESSPFATELRRLAVPHRLFAEELNRQYETRAGLLLRVYPMLLFCAVRAAVRSLVPSRPKPTAVVVSSDIEVVVFGLLRAVVARKTLIVFETFIMTERRSALARCLHHLHYSFVMRFVDVAICHSEVEARANAAKFRTSRTMFTALPYALSVNGRDELREIYGAEARDGDVIVAAGRSGRDYATLAKAIEGLPCRLRIICDWDRPLQGVTSTGSQITVVRNCFKADYLAELARARLVVVPLSQRNASAGQMVLLQAFALAKPVIITQTPTTQEYVADGHDGVFAAFGDAADLRQKIVALLGDPARCAALGERASARYEEAFSTEAYVRKLTYLLREVAGSRAAVPAAAKERLTEA